MVKVKYFGKGMLIALAFIFFTIAGCELISMRMTARDITKDKRSIAKNLGTIIIFGKVKDAQIDKGQMFQRYLMIGHQKYEGFVLEDDTGTVIVWANFLSRRKVIKGAKLKIFGSLKYIDQRYYFVAAEVEALK